jgi:DNA-binding XRE family transcriptional regulator
MQILTIEQKDYAVVPMNDYNNMLKLAQNTQDMVDIRQYRQDLTSGKDEMITSEFAERLIFGENPCLVWREYRTLTLKDMSNATGIDSATLSRIENNKREPSIKQIKAIAKALKLEVDDLI